MLFSNVVVDDSSVGAGVEDSGSVFVSEKVDSLVDVLVEAEDPLEVLSAV